MYVGVCVCALMGLCARALITFTSLFEKLVLHHKESPLTKTCVYAHALMVTHFNRVEIQSSPLIRATSPVSLKYDSYIRVALACSFMRASDSSMNLGKDFTSRSKKRKRKECKSPFLKGY